MTSEAQWHIQGDVMEACSCNVTCPCNFGGDPTQLPCEAVLGLRIQQGNYGNTSLDGLNVVMYVSMPGNPFEGGWTLGAYLDQKANNEQVQALGTILSGQAGGMFAVLSGLVENPLPPKQVPINFETVGSEHRITVPGLLEVGSERIPNPMEGQPPLDTKVNDLSVPFYTGPANVRRSSVFRLSEPNLSFEHSGRSSLIGKFDYTGP
jgi:hypothetical protein